MGLAFKLALPFARWAFRNGLWPLRLLFVGPQAANKQTKTRHNILASLSNTDLFGSLPVPPLP